MFRRTAAFVILAWFFGFVWFAVTLPGRATEARADAVIVVTGSAGRIERGFELLDRKIAPRMLVSGVGREVRVGEFAAEYDVPARTMACCVTLGRQAYDTRSNAIEAGEWVRKTRARTVRLVTADWHMRRAALELERELPPRVTLQRDAVPTHPSLKILFLEYHKFVARLATVLWRNR